MAVRRPVAVLVVALGVLAALASCASPDTVSAGAKDRRPTTTPETSEVAPATEVTPPSSSTSTTAAPPAGDIVEVARVIDGDTIEVTDGTRVRLIGIDTPESVDPRRPVECLGKEAAAHTASLLPVGTDVRLEYDVEREDRYGRTLAYVYRVDDGLFVNAAIARDGFAQQLTIPPNVAKVDEIAAAVAEARAAGRGLWGSACSDAAASAPPTTASVTPSGGAGGCDPAYPDVCIPPGPPSGADLDCSDIPDRRFRVLPPDPHGFDREGDGLGCESG